MTRTSGSCGSTSSSDASAPPRPEVALRVGFNGHWLPLPWEAVFAGDRGAFRDAQFDPPTGAGDGDTGHNPGAPMPEYPAARAAMPRGGIARALTRRADRRRARSAAAAPVALDGRAREVLA